MEVLTEVPNIIDGAPIHNLDAPVRSHVPAGIQNVDTPRRSQARRASTGVYQG